METKNGYLATTKENVGGSWALTRAEAEEFRAYRRQKRMGEAVSAISRSSASITGKEDVVRVVEKALRHRQAGIKTNLLRFSQSRDFLVKSGIKADIIIGGDGETISKVKAYEAKQARKLGGKEVTLVLTPSLLTTCRYGEIKKEIRKVKRAGKGLVFKVWADKTYPFPTLVRMARISSEMGVNCFSVPYFAGCERLRYELSRGCLLEICDLDNFADFKKMARAGVGRMVTSCVSEIYAEWLREVEEELLLESSVKSETKEKEEKTSETALEKKENFVEEKKIEEKNMEEKNAEEKKPPVVITSDLKFV